MTQVVWVLLVLGFMIELAWAVSFATRGCAF